MTNYTITITHGFVGSLATTSTEAAEGLARELHNAGYLVDVNGVRVAYVDESTGHVSTKDYERIFGDPIGCVCSEDYGPCEDHSELLIMREGASQRTADDLSAQFIHDAWGCGAELAPYGRDVLARVDARLAQTRRMGVAWLDDESLCDELSSLVSQVESSLPDHVRADWDDGYLIRRITGGPLFG